MNETIDIKRKDLMIFNRILQQMIDEDIDIEDIINFILFITSNYKVNGKNIYFGKNNDELTTYKIMNITKSKLLDGYYFIKGIGHIKKEEFKKFKFFYIPDRRKRRKNKKDN